MRPINLRYIAISTALVGGLLTGCGSDNDTPQVTEDTVGLSDYGVLRIEHDTATTQSQIAAVFCDLAAPTRAATIDAQFLTGSDSCTVTNDGSGIEDNSALSCAAALSAQSVSAGATLTLGSAVGSYAELARSETDGVFSYALDSLLPRPPNGLVLDIPGDTDFPAFSAVQIPDLQDLVLRSPAAGDSLRGDTVISWNAATDRTGSRILIEATDSDVTVSCSLADDGSFRFSAATQAELGDLFAATDLSIRRQNIVSPTRGDTGLVIITSIK